MENEINYNELAKLLIEAPSQASNIVKEVNKANGGFDKLYNALHNMMINVSIYDSNDIQQHNQRVQRALEAITNCQYPSKTNNETNIDNIQYKKPTNEEKEQLRDELDEYISLGHLPQKLKDYCSQRRYLLEDVYTTDELIERYSDFGITYDPSEGSLTSDWFEKRCFPPKTNLSEKNHTLANLEEEARILTVQEKQVFPTNHR